MEPAVTGRTPRGGVVPESKASLRNGEISEEISLTSGLGTRHDHQSDKKGCR